MSLILFVIMEREMDRQLGGSSALMWVLRWTVMVKRELRQKAKLLVYRSVYVPALTYVYGLLLMTITMRLWVQAAKMCFLCSRCSFAFKRAS